MPQPFRVKQDFRRLDAFIENVENAAEVGGLAMAQGAYEDSQVICPVAVGEPNAGFLKRSGRVFTKSAAGGHGGSQPVGVVVYDANYAAVVHNTNWRYRHGRWMFLREPLMNARRRLEDAAAAFRKVFKR